VQHDVPGPVTIFCKLGTKITTPATTDRWDMMALGQQSAAAHRRRIA